jgi:hypothetical protein
MTGVEDFVQMSITERYSVPYGEVAKIQLERLRQLLADLPAKIPMLRKLIEGQGLGAVSSLEAAAPLLLRNATYKSYPLSFLDKGQFDRLTHWLDGLSAHDLASIDASACRSIDEWIDLIERESEIRIVHSSGTSGKLSFLPRSERELRWVGEIFRRYSEGFGGEPDARPAEGLDTMPIFFPSYRHGAMEGNRLIYSIVKHLRHGNDSEVIALNPGRMSADALSLGGRLKGAESKGELGRAQVAPHLLARRDELLRERAEAPQRLREFFASFIERYRGRRVIVISAGWSQLFDMAVEAESKGIAGVFDPSSVILIGGGTKGRVFPGDYQQRVAKFLGVGAIRDGYGMSECLAATRSCPQGKYHIQPWLIPYLLDSKTGAQAPRSGVHRGHLAFLDLLPVTYWGGFLTGDEVTLNWGDEEPCSCGRIGPYVHNEIRRYAESEGGDDKITCAGATAAHDRALDFILGK